jgi:hypothetical protein
LLGRCHLAIDLAKDQPIIRSHPNKAVGVVCLKLPDISSRSRSTYLQSMPSTTFLLLSLAGRSTRLLPCSPPSILSAWHLRARVAPDHGAAAHISRRSPTDGAATPPVCAPPPPPLVSLHSSPRARSVANRRGVCSQKRTIVLSNVKLTLCAVRGKPQMSVGRPRIPPDPPDVRVAEGSIRARPRVAASATSMVPQMEIATVARGNFRKLP